ncbi:hypothetical protein QUA81_32850, partial [Microcoleus sp. F6_B4]
MNRWQCITSGGIALAVTLLNGQVGWASEPEGIRLHPEVAQITQAIEVKVNRTAAVELIEETPQQKIESSELEVKHNTENKEQKPHSDLTVALESDRDRPHPIPNIEPIEEQPKVATAEIPKVGEIEQP